MKANLVFVRRHSLSDSKLHTSQYALGGGGLFQPMDIIYFTEDILELCEKDAKKFFKNDLGRVIVAEIGPINEVGIIYVAVSTKPKEN